MAESNEGRPHPPHNAAMEQYRLRLFVAGDEPNSRRARENLAHICEEHVSEPCELEITDVLEDFEIALELGIYVTPALLIEAAGPRVTVFGNLSDINKVLKAMGLEESV